MCAPIVVCSKLWLHFGHTPHVPSILVKRLLKQLSYFTFDLLKRITKCKCCGLTWNDTVLLIWYHFMWKLIYIGCICHGLYMIIKNNKGVTSNALVVLKYYMVNNLPNMIYLWVIINSIVWLTLLFLS